MKARAQPHKPAALAAKVAVQVLFAANKSFTVDGLREKLREWFREEVRPEARGVAALSNMELVAALLEANRTLGAVGLQILVAQGMVSLTTTRVEFQKVSDYLRAMTEQSGHPDLTQSMLEVLSCVAYKQPISQAEIDQIFAADKRPAMARLRELRLVEGFAGEDGRLRFATTGEFLRRFNLGGLEDLRANA